MDFGTTDENKELIYDLRQIYATELVGEHLKDIAKARKSDDYISYYKCLKDLYIIVHHKFKKGDEEYKELLKNIILVANKFPMEWTGQSRKSLECSYIEDALNKMEMYLYAQMELAKMFGESKKVSGL